MLHAAIATDVILCNEDFSIIAGHQTQSARLRTAEIQQRGPRLPGSLTTTQNWDPQARRAGGVIM